MEPNVIVMVVTLLLANGTNGVHITPFASPESCFEAARLEATDPKVLRVNCSRLSEGEITLQFAPDAGKPVRSTG